MKYDLHRPCPECPFRSDIEPFLRADRAEEIVEFLARSEFPCHKTTVDATDDEGNPGRIDTPDSQHCAGALIMLEKANRPSQMMRICERLRGENGEPMYDASKLDMEAPVYDSPEEFVQAHEKASE